MSFESSKEEIEEFLASLEDYVPTIPDEVIQYYLTRTGFVGTDPKLRRLISIATQKFVSDIANDALQYCKIRQANAKKQDKRLVLTMDDLTQSSKEYGINIKKPEYFTDRTAAQTGITIDQ